MNRLILVKILSNNCWKLRKKTLTTLYKSLVGSIIDYSSFFIHDISDTNLKKIQAIQNSGVRSIYKQSFDTNTEELCKVAGMCTVLERAVSLNLKFLTKAKINNDWVIQLSNEYLQSINSLKNNKTFLSFYNTS